MAQHGAQVGGEQGERPPAIGDRAQGRAVGVDAPDHHGQQQRPTGCRPGTRRRSDAAVRRIGQVARRAPAPARRSAGCRPASSPGRRRAAAGAEHAGRWRRMTTTDSGARVAASRPKPPVSSAAGDAEAEQVRHPPPDRPAGVAEAGQPGGQRRFHQRRPVSHSLAATMAAMDRAARKPSGEADRARIECDGRRAGLMLRRCCSSGRVSRAGAVARRRCLGGVEGQSPSPFLGRLRHAAQHVVQDAAVPVVVHLVERIDAAEHVAPCRSCRSARWMTSVRSMRGARSSRPRMSSTSSPVRPSALAVHAVLEGQRQHAHADQVGAVDALEAFGDHRLHAEQHGALGGPVARWSRCRIPCRRSPPAARLRPCSCIAAS